MKWFLMAGERPDSQRSTCRPHELKHSLWLFAVAILVAGLWAYFPRLFDSSAPPEDLGSVTIKLEDGGGEGKEKVLKVTMINGSKSNYLFDSEGRTGLGFEHRRPNGDFIRVYPRVLALLSVGEEELTRTCVVVKSGESASCSLKPFLGYSVCDKGVGSGTDEKGQRVGAIFRMGSRIVFDLAAFAGNEIELRCVFGGINGELIAKPIDGTEVRFPGYQTVSNTIRVTIPR